MAYLETHSPAHTLNGEISATRRVLGALRRGFSGLMHALMRNSTGHARLMQVQVLQAKSDAELARMGLRRDDIVERVFRGRF